MDIKKLSLELAAISMIADAAKKRKDELRAQLQGHMDTIGADRVKAELDGETIAYVTTSKPKFKWEVINERKFVDWVAHNHPTEIVESVRESFREVILDKFNYVDDMAISPDGEPVDWLVGHISEPYLITKFHSEGREKLRDAFLSNAIDPRKVLEIE